MNHGIVWLAAWLLLPIAGAPVLSHPSFGRFPSNARVVLAGAVGALLVSFSMTLLALAGIPWSIASVMIGAVILGLALRPLLSGTPSKEPNRERLGALGTLGVALSFGAVLAALLVTGAGGAGSPDLVFFWGLKAQQFAAARTIDAAFLREPLLQYMHVYYPPLWTNLGAFSAMAAGRFAWLSATLTFPLLLAALAIALPGVLRLSVRRTDAAAVAALAVSAIACIGIDAAIGGNAEMPLLVFETLAVAVLLSPDAASPAGQLLCGMLLAGAASTKVEGFPFAAAAGILFLIARRDASGLAWARAARVFAPTALALGAWFAFGVTRRLFVGYSGQGRLFDVHVEHLGSVFRGILSALLAAGHGLPWLIPLLVVIAARPGRQAAIPLGIAAALAAFLVFTYIDRPEDPSLWISWSASRVLSPVAMLLALAAMGAPVVGAAESLPRTPSPSPP